MATRGYITELLCEGAPEGLQEAGLAVTQINISLLSAPGLGSEQTPQPEREAVTGRKLGEVSSGLRVRRPAFQAQS